jgi:hypothetical protein
MPGSGPVNIIIVTTALLFLALVAISTAYGMKFQPKDYVITGFGINNSNPFIKVEGIAGGSYDPSMGDEGYHAYVFETDKGIYQISVAEGSSKPYYGTSHILNKEIKLNECLLTEDTRGKPSFENNTVRYMDDKLKITKVNKVLAIKVILDDPDERCKNGEHVREIIPNKIGSSMNNNSSSVQSPTACTRSNAGCKEINESSIHVADAELRLSYVTLN